MFLIFEHKKSPTTKLNLFFILFSKRLTPPDIMGDPIRGLPFKLSRYITAVMFGWFQGGPKLFPNDASVILLWNTAIEKKIIK